MLIVPDEEKEEERVSFGGHSHREMTTQASNQPKFIQTTTVLLFYFFLPNSFPEGFKGLKTQIGYLTISKMEIEIRGREIRDGE